MLDLNGVALQANTGESSRSDSVSRRRESHPPPLVEPCVTVSRYTAPVVEPLGSAPWRQWMKMPG